MDNNSKPNEIKMSAYKPDFTDDETIAIKSLYDLSNNYYVDKVMKTIEEESKKTFEQKKLDMYNSKMQFLDDQILILHKFLDERPDAETRISIMRDLHKIREHRTLLILFPHYYY